nr:hypothetical protein [Tanacetum cinerariifolium]
LMDEQEKKLQLPPYRSLLKTKDQSF